MAKKNTTDAADPAEIGAVAAAAPEPAGEPEAGPVGALPIQIREISGFTVLSRIDHDGKAYEIGTVIPAEELSTTAAAALLAAGCVTAF